MSFFSKMNSKLDNGYKMTNINCDKCKFSLLINPTNKLLYCAKCDFETKEPAQIIIENEQDDNLLQERINQIETNSFDQELKNMFSNPSKSDEQSKKLSQKLLQGWAMLEEVCPDCMIPIMRSKQGAKLCVGCDNAYQRPQKENDKVQEEKKISTKEQLPQASQQLDQQQSHQKPQNQASKDQCSSYSSNLQLNDKIYKTLNKLLDFYDTRLTAAIQENDIQKVGFLQDKIFDIINCHRRSIQ